VKPETTVADNRRTFRDWVMPPPIAARLWLAVGAAAGYSYVVWLIHPTDGMLLPVWSNQFALLNTAILGLLVSFRTKIAYDRWWEGRILWGSLVNHSRNLCLKARELAGIEGDERAAFVKLVAAFPIALMKHLRGPVTFQELPGFESDPAAPAHVPAEIAGRVMAALQSWRSAGRIDGHTHQIIDTHAAALMDICGACERIRNTPLASAYLSLLRHGLVFGFAFTPWALVQSLELWIVPVQSVAVYFLFGIELTAEEVEQPFGFDRDDLPLETYCDTIRKSAEDILR
jgi:ion channel-forming bestrophin family protein